MAGVARGQKDADMSRHHRGSGIAKGAAWEQARLNAMKQGGWRCSKCSKAGRLEVHHVIPISEGRARTTLRIWPACAASAISTSTAGR